MNADMKRLQYKILLNIVGNKTERQRFKMSFKICSKTDSIVL